MPKSSTLRRADELIGTRWTGGFCACVLGEIFLSPFKCHKNVLPQLSSLPPSAWFWWHSDKCYRDRLKIMPRNKRIDYKLKRNAMERNHHELYLFPCTGNILLWFMILTCNASHTQWHKLHCFALYRLWLFSVFNKINVVLHCGAVAYTYASNGELVLLTMDPHCVG